MYPRTFSKLLSDEFDYKACLLWTFISVLCVMGLVRLGKHFLEKSEKKSERFRLLQQVCFLFLFFILHVLLLIKFCFYRIGKSDEGHRRIFCQDKFRK